MPVSQILKAGPRPLRKRQDADTLSPMSLRRIHGSVIPGVEVRIVKPGIPEAVEESRPGEFLARGHGLMKGSYNKPAETVQASPPTVAPHWRPVFSFISYMC